MEHFDEWFIDDDSKKNFDEVMKHKGKQPIRKDSDRTSPDDAALEGAKLVAAMRNKSMDEYAAKVVRRLKAFTGKVVAREKLTAIIAEAIIKTAFLAGYARGWYEGKGENDE